MTFGVETINVFLSTLLVLVGTVSCAGHEKQASPYSGSSTAWIVSYQQRVASGCECDTEECFTSAKRDLDTFVAARGGFDEMPAEIHNARAEFEKCLQEGTLDLPRDLLLAAEKICSCHSSRCANDYIDMVRRFELKYGFEPPEEQELPGRFGIGTLVKHGKDGEPDTAATAARLEQCVLAASTSAENVLERQRLFTDAVCHCKDANCLSNLRGEFTISSSPSPVLVVGKRGSIDSELRALEKRTCECVGRNMVRSFFEEIFGPAAGAIPVSVSCSD